MNPLSRCAVFALASTLIACGGGGAKFAAGKENAAAALFQAGQTEPILPDYQVLVAQDVLGCVLASPRATSSGFEIGNARSWLFLVPTFLNFNLAVPGIGFL